MQWWCLKYDWPCLFYCSKCYLLELGSEVDTKVSPAGNAETWHSQVCIPKAQFARQQPPRTRGSSSTVTEPPLRVRYGPGGASQHFVMPELKRLFFKKSNEIDPQAAVADMGFPRQAARVNKHGDIGVQGMQKHDPAQVVDLLIKVPVVFLDSAMQLIPHSK